ncbi:MAG: lysophospholipase [Gammaproteobacteria bacterium]|nr:lysophospholipase [Gammaproteobacteria bacterium]
MKKVWLSLIVLWLVFMLAACAAQRTSGESIVSPLLFPEPEADFEQWQEKVRAHVTSVSMSHRSRDDIELNLPFSVRANPAVPFRGKFLLVHGLNDSAYVWRDMATEIADLGYEVRAILLPGHGSHPRQMLEVRYQQWLDVTREHFRLWDTGDAPIYVGGYSMGGVLATILALENPHISGLLLVSPAYHSRLNSYLRWAWLYRRFRPWLFGGMIGEDNPGKYNSIPINSADQYYRITRYLKRNWDKKLSMPSLLVISTDDSVVDHSVVRERFVHRFTHDERMLITYSNEPLAAVTNEIIRPSAYPQLRILNQSHLSLINSPANPLLGQAGTLLVCNGNEPEIFFGCMRASNHWFGAQNTPSPDDQKVARSTYNPDFGTIVESFQKVFH